MGNDGRGGKPVGRAAAAGVRRGGSPAGSSKRGARPSALPLIILALVAGLGGGVAIGWFIGHGSQEAATPTATAATSTTGGTSTTADAGAAYGVVTVSGEPLPRFDNASTDTAIGLTIPEISGEDFAGHPYTISPNGTAKLIVALAHWCPYCQQELPVLTGWHASADLPAGVEVFLLTVFTTPERGNYPPGPWIAASGWSGPVLVDDQAGSIAYALGIASVPYNLFVAPDGTVVGRATGGRTAAQLDADIRQLLGL